MFVLQVLCHILPSLVKLRKEGLDAQEKIKGYMWVYLSITVAEPTSLIEYGIPSLCTNFVGSL